MDHSRAYYKGFLNAEQDSAKESRERSQDARDWLKKIAVSEFYNPPTDDPEKQEYEDGWRAGKALLFLSRQRRVSG